MKKKEENNGSQIGIENMSDISTIRNILMGQQIEESENKFQSIQDRIDEHDRQIQDKLESLKRNMDSRIASLEQEIDERFEKLESLFMENLGTLEKKTDKGLAKISSKLEQSSRNDKKQIGKLLSQMGERLMKD